MALEVRGWPAGGLFTLTTSPGGFDESCAMPANSDSMTIQVSGYATSAGATFTLALP